jgi:hypothetical protein
MKLKAGILIFILLLATGQYFAGQTDRVPRVDVKAFLTYGKTGDQTEKNWIDDQSREYPRDFQENCSSPFSVLLAGVLFNSESKTWHVSPWILDPLLLDRPPPVQGVLTSS